MTQDARQRLGVHTAGQGVGREAMSQIVEAKVGQGGCFQNFLQLAVCAAGVDRRFRVERIMEDPGRVGASFTIFQQFRCAGRKDDLSYPGIGLGVPCYQPASFSLWRVRLMRSIPFPASKSDHISPQISPSRRPVVISV